MKYYRLLSMLPPLPDVVDEGTPIPLSECLEALNLELSGSDRALALAVLSQIDCENIEAHLQGWDTWDARGPASKEAVDERRDLPPHLSEFLEAYDAGSISDAYPFDALWRGYYAFLLEAAEAGGSRYLKEWVIYEITLRDALAHHRADALGLNVESKSSGLPDLGGDDFIELISMLPEASNPMERERLIDMERLHHRDSIVGIDPFSTDAVLAYLSGMLILDRWDIGKKVPDVSQMLEVFA